MQWIRPNSYREDLYVIMLGGIRIKMQSGKHLKMVGHPWVNIADLAQVDTATPGKAYSFLKVSYIS